MPLHLPVSLQYLFRHTPSGGWRRRGPREQRVPKIATLALPAVAPPVCAMSGEPRRFTGSWAMRTGLTGLSVMAPAQALAVCAGCICCFPDTQAGIRGIYLLGREAIR